MRELKMPSSNRCRRSCLAAGAGFTLVELLVVIAIISVLVALLLPAIQAAREASRRASCLNNISQLGLALHGYEFSRETFPAGSTNPDGPIRDEPDGIHVSWVVHVLPFIEQYNAYRLFDQDAGAYAVKNQLVRTLQIPLLVCPSYPGAVRSAESAAHTTYGGCHHHEEAPIDVKNTGTLFLNSRIRFRDILDGSSQTLLVGEILPDQDHGLGWVSGTRATLRNAGELLGLGDLRRREANSKTSSGDRPSPLAVGGFGGAHPGTMTATFADGSSRTISESIDRDVFSRLGHRADGELLDGEAY